MPEYSRLEESLILIINRLEKPVLAWKPFGPFIYPFLRMFMIKLIDTKDEMYQKVLAEPIHFSTYIMIYVDKNRILTFFDKDARLVKIRQRFPARRSDFKKSDFGELTRYYCVLYPILVLKRDLLVKMFCDEIANQDYDTIFKIFPGWLLNSKEPFKKQQIQEIDGIWMRVASLLLKTFAAMGNEMLSGKEGEKIIERFEKELWAQLGID